MHPLDLINGVVLTYFLVLNLTYLGLTLIALPRLRGYARRLKAVDMDRMLASGALPPVAILVPAFDEQEACVDAVRALVALSYPTYEVIVVNDGSRDQTLARLIQAFALVPAARHPMGALPTEPIRGVYRSETYPQLWLLDKENGGKPDALNAGLNHARAPIVVTMDADCLLEREAILRVVRPFLEDRDTIAVGGIVRVVNGCVVAHGRVTQVRLPRSLLARFQILEYLRAFLSGRVGWSQLNALLIVSGAFAVFRRGPVVETGGFSRDTVGEDMELVLRLHRHCRDLGQRCRIQFVPDPVAWTEVPERALSLAAQRDRWQRGLIESIWRHRGMLFNPRYGAIGMLAMPWFLFFEGVGPLVEVIGYAAFVIALFMGRVSGDFAAAFLGVSVLFGAALSVGAVTLEELTFRRYADRRDLLRLFWLALAENFGYRQLTSWWRTLGLLRVLRRAGKWGEMERRERSDGPQVKKPRRERQLRLRA